MHVAGDIGEDVDRSDLFGERGDGAAGADIELALFRPLQIIERVAIDIARQTLAPSATNASAMARPIP